MKHARKVLKPFAYTDSVSTDIRKRIAKEQKRLREQQASIVRLVARRVP